MSRKRWAAVVHAAIVVVGLLFLLLLLLPCVQQVRDGEGWSWSANCLKQIGIALQAYHEVNGQLPPAVVRDKTGRPLYSWRVLLLPYIEEGELYKKFRLDEPWDSDHNQQLAREAPRCYRPISSLDGRRDQTRYQVLVGPGTAFERPGLAWNDFPDGRGSTLLVVESARPVVWSKPDDMDYDPVGTLPQFGAGYTRAVHFLCREVGRRPGFVACFADDSVRFVLNSTDERVIRALITRNGGEPVDMDRLK